MGADSVGENSEMNKFVFTRQVLTEATKGDTEHSDADSESDASIVTVNLEELSETDSESDASVVTVNLELFLWHMS